MSELLIAVALFVLSHMLPMYAPWRQALEQRWGARLFLTLYSLLSLGLLVWIGIAYSRAPVVIVWHWALWLTWVPVLLMPFACILLVAGVTSPNPFSLGAGAKGYDPKRPGIVSVTRHPVMWALVIWSSSHIFPNGDLASIVLFGLMLLLSLTGTRTIERNRQRRQSGEQWALWYPGTCNIPFCAERPVDWSGIGWVRLLGGLLLFLVLLLSHRWLIGVMPPQLLML